VIKGRLQALELSSEKLAAWFCRGATLVVFLSLMLATLRHEFSVLRSSEVGPAYPPVLYGLMPSPGTSPVKAAAGAAGGDFSQVYTSALALRHGESAYFPSTPAYADRFGRPAGYPPLMNWLCVPLTYLSYYHALLVSVLLSIALFTSVSAWLLWMMGLARHIPRLLAMQAALYFLTPIGFTHLERGQFDLIVASATALGLACTFLPRQATASAIVSGALATLKWTTVPFFGCFGAFAFALGSGRRRWCYVLILALMALGTAAFWHSVGEYWYTIRVFELEAKPRGITFMYYLPRSIAKVLPVVVTVLVVGVAWLSGRKRASNDEMLQAMAVPVAILILSLTTCYGTVSYEYHTVTLLGATPGLIVWLERERAVPLWVKAAAAGGFGVFLCVAFRTFQIEPPFDARAMTRVYGVFSAYMLAICMLVALSRSGRLPRSIAGSWPPPPH
jgi:glycosyl transferase family 87